ncbi:ABC transporter permease family protein [Streptomyces rubiginosohelvolus]|uniref:FtsX-like permease family protein n=1 Tax=Streptomyces rubiginosohelvolus TaxID=67362 RepID=A0ABW6F491_9ACTN
MNTGRSLNRQLLRMGRAAGRGSADGRIRFVALTIATCVLAVTLAAAVAAWATYDERTERGAARTPVLRLHDGQTPEEAPLRIQLYVDDVHDQQVEVIYVEPMIADAPLPPGVSRWPGPGEAVLSPSLAADGVEDRYGRVVGSIAPEGLASPGERYAYARPADGTLAADHALLATGFGSKDAGGFGDLATVRPLSVFLSLLIAMLGLPAGLFAVVATRLGAAGRDRRTALLGALGGGRRQVALLSTGEAAPALLLGVALTAPVLGAALVTDLRIPFVGYVLAASDMRSHVWPLVLALIASPLLIVALVVLMHQWAGPGRSTRPRSTGRGRLVKVAAGLCPVFLGILSWSPTAFATYGATRTVVLVSLLGTVGALATVPAAVALLLSAAGRGVTALGRRRGWAGTLLAGRWTQGRPGYLSRLVAGVVIALGLLSVVQVYPSMHSASVQGALAMRERFGHSLLTVQMPHGAEGRTGAWVEKLPPGAEVAVLDSTLGLANGAGEVKETPDGPVEVRQAVTVRGNCGALRGLGLECPAGRRAQDVLLSDSSPALRALLPPSVAQVGVDRGPLAPRQGNVLVVYSPQGEALPLGTLKRDALSILGPGALVEAVGQGWIGGAALLSSQLRWVTLLGVVGVGLVAMAAALNCLAEVLRFARSIAPVSVVSGSRRVYVTVAAWTLAAPLCAAAALGTVSAVWVTLPYTTPPRSGELPPLMLSASVATLCALALVVACLAAWSAVRESERWRPRHD